MKEVEAREGATIGDQLVQATQPAQRRLNRDRRGMASFTKAASFETQ